MARPAVVIRYGTAYPDAVIDQLATEVEASGVPALLEPADPSARIVVELPAESAVALSDPPLAAVVDAVVAVARRRHRRQRAAGEVREVSVTLLLPGGAGVVLPVETAGEEPGPLVTAVAARLAAGTLTPGTWRWDPSAGTLLAGSG